MDLLQTIKKTGRSVGHAIVGAEGSPEDGDILDTLKKEHDEVGQLLKQLVESESASERRGLVKKIKTALIPHIKAEQKVVYDAVLALKDRDAKTDGEEGYIEHKLAAETLSLLGKISNTMSPEFSAAAKVLKELIEHHVEEEERNIWTDVKESFSDSQRLAMNRKFEAAKKRVRTAQ
jgi:hemerythrin-like domain-containing protein